MSRFECVLLMLSLVYMLFLSKKSRDKFIQEIVDKVEEGLGRHK